jgi:hypothetical protein
MGTVRGDLVGVVYVSVGGGVVALKAGDTIPDGVELGEHLIEHPATKADSGAGVRRARSH